MSKKYELEALKRVQQVETPPFVFTRIEAQIEKEEAINMPKQWAWGLSLACSILLVINISFFISQNESAVAQTEDANLLEEVGLEQSNQLYYE